MVRPFKQQRNQTADQTSAAPQRLHKLLAMAGLGSRREMEELIAAGQVTVNGKVAEVGARATVADAVQVDGRPVRLRSTVELPQVLLYHKPEGEIVSRRDPQGRATVFDKLPRVKGGKWIAVGRLDINTSGLLIFTTSGELANRFMHPRYEVEREYAVRIFGELTEEQIRQLLQGVELEDGHAGFDQIQASGGEGSNRWYQVVLHEGRNREVRRLFELFQLPVSRLLRVRFGPVALPSRLKRGMMMTVEPRDVLKLLDWAGLEAPAGPLRQRSRREMEKAATAYTPRSRARDVAPAAARAGRGRAPSHAAPAGAQRRRTSADATVAKPPKRRSSGRN